MKDSEKAVICRLLDQVICETVSDVSRQDKYGGVMYSASPDGNRAEFCGVFCYKLHVQLAIGYGPELSDPHGVLQGTGKTRRHVNFHSAEDINSDILSGLIRQAADRALAEQE